MATRQYNNTRRTQVTGLTDIIRNLISGTANRQRRPERVSEKTIENMEDLKQNFHPTNIGRALGRKSVGLIGDTIGAIGKKAGDLFKNKTGRTKEVKENKKNNPLYTKVSEGSDKPVRKNDSLSDVLSKIHNLLKLNVQNNRKQHEIEKNFAKEKEDERELRHKELLKALGGLTGGVSTVTKVESEKKGSFFGDLLKNVGDMLENFKKILGPLLDFVQSVGKDLLLNLVKFLRSPLFGVFLGPLLLAGSLLALADIIKKELQSQTVDLATERGGQKAGEAMKKVQITKDMIESLPEGSTERAQMEQEMLKQEEEVQKNVVKKQAIAEKYLKNKGYSKFDKTMLGIKYGEEYKKDKNGEEAPQSLIKEANAFAEKELEKNVDLPKGVTPSKAGAGRGMISPIISEAPTATPAPPSSDRSSRRVQAAIEEQFYQEEVKAAKRSITINSPKTVVAGDTKAQSIDIEESAPVRIDDPTLKHIQERNLRRF